MNYNPIRKGYLRNNYIFSLCIVIIIFILVGCSNNQIKKNSDIENELGSLREKCKQYEETIGELMQENEKMKEKNNILVEGNRELSNKVTALEKQIEKYIEDLTKSLSANDYAIIDENNSISLDTSYTNLKLTEINSSYVGEIWVGKRVYKYYQHIFEDNVSIYTSNVNHDIKGRDINDYRISQIDITSEKFKTPRDINIGQSYEDIINAYGQGIKSGDSLVYTYNDLQMEFDFKDDKLISIRMRILPSD